MGKTPTLRIDQDRNEVFVRGRRVHLSKKEWDMLLALKATNRTTSREVLLRTVWGHDDDMDVDTRTVDQHVARLRRKLGVPAVETVPGFGYKYVGDDQDPGKSGQERPTIGGDATMSKQRVTPTLCPHCVKHGRTPAYVHEPPAWVRVLLALRSGVKGDRTGTVGTVAQIAERIGVSRQRASLLVTEAEGHGALNTPFGKVGVFGKSPWGKQLLQSWVNAGWPSDARVSQKAARGA